MDEKNPYIEAIRKRALGYEIEEQTTLIEETPNGVKKKIVKTKKHIPPDLACARYLLEGKKSADEVLKEITDGNY